MDGTDRSGDQIREANALYWESETSVNRIADQLGLSKGSLYAAIEPLASESYCPLCTAPLVYLNRTALEKGHLQCSKCSTEFSEKGTSGPTRRSGAGDTVKTKSHPGTNGSHTAIDIDPPQEPESLETIETQEEAEGPLEATAAGDEAAERASGQLLLSTTMLSLGVGLLLARVLRR